MSTATRDRKADTILRSLAPRLNVPTAELRYFDGGHVVLDACAGAIAEAIIETFSR